MRVPLPMLLACAAVVVSSCSAQNAVVHGERLLPEAAVLLPQAANVATADYYDGRLSYTIDATYPATEVIEQLDSNLEAGGWSAIEREAVFGSSQSALKQWTFVSVKGTDSYVWSGQWRNEFGTICAVELRFAGRTESGEPRPTGKLTITSTAYSAATIRALRTVVR